MADDDYRNDESDGNSPQHADHYSYNHDQTVVGLCSRIVVLLSCGEQNTRFIDLDYMFISEDSVQAANTLPWVYSIEVN